MEKNLLDRLADCVTERLFGIGSIELREAVMELQVEVANLAAAGDATTEEG